MKTVSKTRRSGAQTPASVKERGRPRPLASQDRLFRHADEGVLVRSLGFTLLELLVVIAIIGLIAALAIPTIGKFKPNYTASATRQLLDALARARQLAISQRTTVYMVFVPGNFWNDPAYNAPWFQALPSRCTNLLDKQFVGYNFVSLRSLGDQPGRPTARYLDSWKTLPEGAFIYPAKFLRNNTSFVVNTNDASANPFPCWKVIGFDRTNAIPFPSEDAPKVRGGYVSVPYLAFDYMGRLVSGDPANPEIIPLAQGSISFSRGPDRKGVAALPSFSERPLGNATNGSTYNIVYVERVTGRARAFQPEIK